RLRRLILRRVVAVERRLHRRELDHHVARAAGTLHRLRCAATRKETRAEPLECRLGGRDIVLVALGIAYIDMGNPVSFGHLLLPCSLSWPASRPEWPAPRRACRARQRSVAPPRGGWRRRAVHPPASSRVSGRRE